MIISLEEAKLILRVDGDELDAEILPILEAIPVYLKTTTGVDWGKNPNSLVFAVSKLLLILWFEGYTTDSSMMQRTIDNLLMTLSVMGRDINPQGEN